jgi:hypothetical protein
MASMSERRFSDDEIARVLERAAEESVHATPSSGVSPARGLTLAEVQAIASEAGIAPDAVARAAAAVARGEDRRPEVKRWLGLPVEVAHEVAIDGPVSDAAWDEMVAQLQLTFDATGRQRQARGVREWRHDDVRATLEPAPTGYRLRIATRRGYGSLVLAWFGTVSIAAGGLVAALIVAKGGFSDPSAPWAAPGLPLTIGLALIAVDAVSLRAWGRQRMEQLERLARELSEVERRHESPALPPR